MSDMKRNTMPDCYRTDCFANKSGKCSCLSKKYFEGCENCAFYRFDLEYFNMYPEQVGPKTSIEKRKQIYDYALELEMKNSNYVSLEERCAIKDAAYIRVKNEERQLKESYYKNIA